MVSQPRFLGVDGFVQMIWTGDLARDVWLAVLQNGALLCEGKKKLHRRRFLKLDKVSRTCFGLLSVFFFFLILHLCAVGYDWVGGRGTTPTEKENRKFRTREVAGLG